MNHENARKALAKLIEERREDFVGLSRMLGRNPSYIQQYIRRGSPKKLSEEDRAKLALYFGVSETLLGGPPEAVAADDGSLIPIARYDVRASAGPGAFDGSELPSAHHGFSKDFLEYVTRARPTDLSIIRVEGDSMFPTLSDGDDIMVDRSAALRKLTDGIYVLRHDDALLVKRITVSPASGKLTIASDNSAHATWHDCDPKKVDIVGRVVWSGRRIR